MGGPGRMAGILRGAGLVGAAAMAAALALPVAAAPATAATPIATCGANCQVLVASAAVATGAADAAPVITAGLAAVPAGWTVRLNPGTYRVARPVVVPSGVTLAGSGMDATRLVLDRRSWANFGYSFVVVPGTAAKGSTVRDLTVDGNRVAVDAVGASVAPAANQGGGVKLGSGWTVQRVRLSNLNYFKVWAKDVAGATVADCRFEEKGTGVSSGNDNVGGGGVNGLVVRNNYFGPNSVGNSIDLVRGSNVRIEGNQIVGTAAAPHNLYLEGTTEAVVAGNTLAFSSISIQSNSGYSSATEVVNPRGVSVTGNKVTDPAAQGISLRYDIPKNTTIQGGGNRIANNEVTRAGVAGIIVLAAANGLASAPDAVVANRVTDAFTRGTSSWNCGYGVTTAAGIVIGAAAGSEVSANTVSETRSPARTLVGVQYGVTSSRGVVVSVRTVTPNVVVGVATAELRTV